MTTPVSIDPPVKVLLVADGAGADIHAGLEGCGLQVLAVSAEAKFQKHIESGHADIVVVDGAAGLDRLRAVAGETQRPPVVYLSHCETPADIVDALKAGAADYAVRGEIFRAEDAALLALVVRRTLAAARRHRSAEALLSEVNHRVANSLGLVAALVRMQASVTRDKAALAALQETQARITAIGNVHRRLYASTTVGQVECKDYLANLLSELESALHDERRPLRITFDAVSVALPTDKAVNIGLIISELVTNAFKYAYGDGVKGEIRVTVSQAGAARLCIAVEDDGCGFSPGDPVKGTGLGTRIMTAMAASLGSRIDYDGARPAGVRAVLEFGID